VVVGQLDGVVGVLDHRVALTGLLAQVGAQERAPLVEGDLADPGARVVEAADPGPVAVGDQEGLLGELLGNQAAPEQPLQQADHFGVFAEVELVERLLSHLDC